jgi:myo-inositol-1(or 4)-monophosphatase
VSYQKELEFAKELAYEAGNIMRRYFRAEDIGTEWKADDTPVTVADLKINRLVIDKVKEVFPNQGVLGEELSYKPERQLIWVVDPIDGTAPFRLGIPVSTFSLALVDRKDGQPLVAVTYDPYLDHLYNATIGDGAYLNGNKIQASKSAKLHQGSVSIYGPPLKTKKINYSQGRTIDEVRRRKARNFSFASGVYTASKVATGEFASVAIGNDPPWDVAAAALLVQEGGGVVSNLEGGVRRFDEPGLGCVLSANPKVHQEMLDIIKDSGV